LGVAIISGCDASPVFQLAEPALDDIAASNGYVGDVAGRQGEGDRSAQVIDAKSMPEFVGPRRINALA
jgi:hypothetical protein